MARTWEMSPAARDLRRCRQSMLGPAAAGCSVFIHTRAGAVWIRQ
jgi:hypothetical protein